MDVRSIAVWSILVLGAASACGTAQDGGSPSSSRQDLAKVPLEPPPPIQQVDEPVADFMNRTEAGESANAWEVAEFFCFDSQTGECPPGEPSPAERARLRQQIEEHDRQLREAMPEGGTTPRLVARLALDGTGNRRAELVAWRSRAGELCTESQIGSGDFVWGVNPSGPCLSEPRCDVLCLELADSTEVGDRVLVGTVSASADELRVTSRDGTVRRYPIDGPHVLDFPRRVFMVDLGSVSYRRLELVREGEVIGRVARAKQELAFEACTERLGDPFDLSEDATEEEFERLERRFADCMTSHETTP
jgi:hypothetical protein